jgi:hypothetical protein
MIRVAKVKRLKTKSGGGISRRPILVKRKLPPQNRVVRIRKKYMRPCDGRVFLVKMLYS